MSTNEQKVFKALQDPHWDWRTLEGLKRSTGLTAPLVLEILLSYPSDVEIVVSQQYGLLFAPKGKRGLGVTTFERALDYLSFGRRYGPA